MRRANWVIAAVLGALLSASAPVFAQPDLEPGPGVLSSEQIERLQSLPPAERQAEMERLREQWRALTREERAARREQMRGQWQHMSPEQRQQMRQVLREYRDSVSPGERMAGRERLRGR